jgi:tetratricopeptide (TPR) repeat protein
MAKKKGKSRRRRRRKRMPPRRPKPAELARAQALWERGKGQEAIAILENLVERHPRDLGCHTLLGSIYGDSGNLLEAIHHLEAAAKLSRRDPEVLLLLGAAYGEYSLPAHTLLTLRECLRYKLNEEVAEGVQAMIEDSTEKIGLVAARCGISPRKMEHAAYLMESGRLANERGEYAEGVKVSKEAARLVRSWATPRNNLALAYFALGQWDEAIATEREVLERIDDQNVHALGNLVRFLTASGNTDEARPYLPRLEQTESTDPDAYIKVAEAYATLEEDAEVYATLKKAQREGAELNASMLHFLGTAAANLGKDREALACWRESLLLNPASFRLKDFMDVLRQGLKKSAPAYRFPYFSGQNMVSEKAFKDFIDRLGSLRTSEEKTEQEMCSFGEKYPYVADVFSDLLWYGGENEQTSAIETLRMLGSERAVAALQAFALSQVGNEDQRMMALNALLDLGVFGEDEPVRLWLKGQWREVLLRRQLISEEQEWKYSAQVLILVEKATMAFNEGEDEKAEELYKKAIALEPRAKQAYGNLGALYFRQGRHAEAEASLKKAIEMDHDYVFPRCNLASMRIAQGKLEEAAEILKPIAELRTLRPQEILFYNRISADLFIAQEEYELAEQCLEIILAMEPEDEDAQRRLVMVQIMKGSKDMFARMEERNRRRRERERRKPLKGLDLQSCLSRYTKNNLTAVAQALNIRRPSGIRKAELITFLAKSLAHRAVVEEAWRNLNNEEQEALRFVLAQGGIVPYDEVSQKYGDDLEEYYYWYYRKPETTIGCLRLHGLLFEGGHGDEVVLAIPTEVRGLLDDLEQSPPGVED